jgi:hypothetical protein
MIVWGMLFLRELASIPLLMSSQTGKKGGDFLVNCSGNASFLTVGSIARPPCVSHLFFIGRILRPRYFPAMKS